MSDTLIRVLSKEAGLRGLYAITTDTAAEAARRHQTSPAATAVMGRAIAQAAVIGGAQLKIRQNIAIKYQGDGPLKKLIVESDAYGRLRGYVATPDIDIPLTLGEHNSAAALGSGQITVVKDVRLRDLIESAVPLKLEDMDIAITRFLLQSEQVASFVETGTLLDNVGHIAASGGLLIQALPEGTPELVDFVKNRLDELPNIATLIRDGISPSVIFDRVFDDIAYDIIEERGLKFQCSCSRDRSRQALMMVPEQDLQQLVSEGEAIIDCHFCHERYLFEADELQQLAALRSASDKLA